MGCKTVINTYHLPSGCPIFPIYHPLQTLKALFLPSLLHLHTETESQHHFHKAKNAKFVLKSVRKHLI